MSRPRPPKHSSSGLPSAAYAQQATAGPSSASSAQQPPGHGLPTASFPPGQPQVPGTNTGPAAGSTSAQANTSIGEEYGIRRRLGPGGPFVPTPADWKPEHHLSPQYIVEWTEDYLKDVQRLRSEGSIPPTFPGHLTIGFDPEVLVKNHILWDDRVKPNNLKNPIHPILRQDRWKSVPPEMYRFLHPALRLASKFLTAASCSQFWTTLFAGRRETDLYASVAHGTGQQHIRHDVDASSDSYWAFRERFNWWANQADAITFHFQAPFETPMGSRKGITAQCIFVHRSQVAQSLHTEDWLQPGAWADTPWHGECGCRASPGD